MAPLPPTLTSRFLALMLRFLMDAGIPHTKQIVKKMFMLPLPALVITLGVGENPLLTSWENLCMEMSLVLQVNFPHRLHS